MGAMTAAMRAAKRSASPVWLRWALVTNGRIVHDAVLAPDRVLAFKDGTISEARDVDDALFARACDGRWHLRLPPSARGRLSAGTLSELRSGLAPHEWCEVVLSDGARGRIVLDERTAVLLQLVERPPARTPSRLPEAVRGGLFARTDWWFSAFVAGSVLVHFAFVAWLLEADWPIEDPTIITPQVAEVLFTPLPPPIDAPPMDRSDARTDGPPNDRTDAPTHERRDGHPTLDADARARSAAHDALALVLGGISAERTGLRDLLANGGPSTDEATLLADARSALASTEHGALEERDSSSIEGTERALGTLRTRDRAGAAVDEGPTMVERVVVRRPQLEEIDYDPGPGSFDGAELLRAVRARMAAIQHCYEHEITTGDPDLNGRITVAFTVMPVGSVANVRATENTTGSLALAACAERSLRNLRVRTVPEDPQPVSFPLVFHRAQ